MKKSLIEEALIEDFRKEAAIVLDKYSHKIADMSAPACNWGGCMATLPASIAYFDVQEYLDE